jgi:D-arabinose 1-dehydrogenase-like Zn-dependent alcohol dehydrogenase
MILENVKQSLRLVEVATPVIGPNEALIRVHACGVCGSDLHLIDGEFGDYAHMPVIPGHEVAGVIEAVGSEVTHLKAGDRVGVAWVQNTCGVCRYCLRGETVLCIEQKATGINTDGGYADYVKVRARDVVKVPDAISLLDAAPLFCAGVTVFTPFRLTGFHPRDRVAVIGLGGLGHLAVQFAHALDAVTIAVDRKDDKLDLARKLGADEVYNSSTDAWVAALNSAGGATLIFCTANSAKVMGQALDALAPDGTVVILAVSTDPLQLPAPATMIPTRKRIMGSQTGSLRDIEDMLAIAAKHGVRPMIETMSLENAEAALDQLRRGTPRFRIVLDIKAEIPATPAPTKQEPAFA